MANRTVVRCTGGVIVRRSVPCVGEEMYASAIDIGDSNGPASDIVPWCKMRSNKGGLKKKTSDEGYFSRPSVQARGASYVFSRVGGADTSPWWTGEWHDSMTSKQQKQCMWFFCYRVRSERRASGERAESERRENYSMRNVCRDQSARFILCADCAKGKNISAVYRCCRLEANRSYRART